MAARAMGLQIDVVNATTSREINLAFANFVRERPDALFVAPGYFLRPAPRAANPARVAPCDPRGVFDTRVCRSWRLDELRY